MHKEHGSLDIIAAQYEVLLVRQLLELVDELARPPYQSKESLSLIKMIVDKYAAFWGHDINESENQEIKELALVI